MIGLPPGVAEVALFAAFVGFIGVVTRGVRRRRVFTPAETGDVPDLRTDQRVSATVRRVWRDAQQNVWLVEASLGKRRFSFCATDYAENGERYAALVGKNADFAWFALSTLAPGGAEAMQNQIKDADKVDLSTNPVRLVRAGQFANDYVVIGRILSRRDETVDDVPVTVYRTQVVRSDDLTLVLELAAERADDKRFADQSMVHGSARLFGYLAT